MKEAIRNVVDGLNSSQKKAVEQVDGPLMVLAGAGSGKTRTLVTRVANLIANEGVPPSRILAVTFSNKAATEMRERLASYLGRNSQLFNITTFHSFCARLLRTEAQHIGLSKSFSIYDDSESNAVIKAILSRHGISQKEIHPSEIKYYLADLKNVGFFEDCWKLPLYEENEDYLESLSRDEWYRYYSEYENELRRSNAVDFGGLITGVIQLFCQFPEVLERYRERFHYILVDEYQDTNRAQFLLVHLLASQRKNLCVVGDEDQSIYSWRGADIFNILNFEKYYPDFEMIKLEQNYRSTQNIINAASYVINRNVERKGKKLWTDNAEGEKITVLESRDDKEEANKIADLIEELIRDRVNADDIAIFYRNNSQSRLIEDSLRVKKIPYRIVGGIKFYDRKEIKDLLCYLRILINSNDSLALSRIVNVPARGIGATTLRKLEMIAIENQLSLFDVLVAYFEGNSIDFSSIRMNKKAKQALGQFMTMIQELRDSFQTDSLSQIYQQILMESGYLEALRAEKTYEAKARIENLEEFGQAIIDFEESFRERTLETSDQEVSSESVLLNFLESISLDPSQRDENTENNGEVSLMTIHSSKGLEYPNVFVVGLEEGLFPSSQSLEDEDNRLEEERRLFYVAMTRAMEKLCLSYAQSRMLWGQLKFNDPSRFLFELPEESINWFSEFYGNNKKKAKKSSRKKVSLDFDNQGVHVDYDDEFNQSYSTSFDAGVSKSRQASKLKNSSIQIPAEGSKIKHFLYGQGIVENSQGTGKSSKLTVRFEDGSKKVFMAAYTPLEIL